MAVEIIMPKAGMAMEEGKVLKWLKQVGDTVEAGEPLLEIETDKVSMEVEADVSGVLIAITKEEGEVVPVTEVIAYIGEAGEKPPESGSKPAAPVAEAAPAAAAPTKAPAPKSGEDYDVIVVGGGPGGYVAAIKAAQLGGKVAIVEKDVVGGTCLNRGCIPTKTYLKNAELIKSLAHAKQRGVMIKDASVTMDMEAAVQNKNNVVKTLTSGVEGLLKSNGVAIFYGQGTLADEKTVQVGDKKLKGNAIIWAGGSEVSRINIEGIESKKVLTSTEILDLKEVPKALAVIGGGVVGIELASVFAAYGTEVTVIEAMDHILPNMDAEVTAELTKVLQKDGIKILTKTTLSKVEEEGGGLKLTLGDGAAISCDYALLSIGRSPDLSGMGNVSLAMEKGKVKVDERMETSVKGIYAPGDINGMNMLAHAAFKMGEIAAENAMGGNAKVNLKHVPGCVYTMPEIGTVGLTEENAKKQYDIAVGKFPFAANGRALASGESIGFIKVITDKRYGEILGVHIIGPNATEMINEAAVLMSSEITAHEVADLIHGHPTFSEAFMEAVADSLGVCIHLPKKG